MQGILASVSTEYGVAAAMAIIALLLGGAALGVGQRFRPRQTPPVLRPNEFGGRSGHKTWVQFRVRYAVLALLFVAFDMEMVFMFPWAVAFRSMGLIGLADMFVFILILASAIIFAWKAGAFEWER